MNIQMLKLITLGSFLIISGNVNANKNLQTPSSEIPDIREFTLNKDVNPCDDFHAYVCSNVEKSFKLREDRSSHTFSFSDSSERILEAKKKFFQNIDNEKKLSKRSLQMKNYYKACMNEKVAVEQEKKLVKEIATEMNKITSIEQFVELLWPRVADIFVKPPKCGRKWKLCSKSRLLLILAFLRKGFCYQMLGPLFFLSSSRVRILIKEDLPKLRLRLRSLVSWHNWTQQANHLSEVDGVSFSRCVCIVDATEHQCNRPKSRQQNFYSSNLR